MIVDSSKYEITGAPDSIYLSFYEDDLNMLMLYYDTVRIGLFKAKCFTEDYHGGKFAESGHNIAVGIKSDGTLSASGRAALPCPPDCGEKLEDTVTLADYKYEGVIKFVPDEFYKAFTDELYELIGKYKHFKKS
jgi:hypothetical protein